MCTLAVALFPQMNKSKACRAGPGDEATLAAFFNAYNLHVLVSDPWREFWERGYTHVCWRIQGSFLTDSQQLAKKGP